MFASLSLSLSFQANFKRSRHIDSKGKTVEKSSEQAIPLSPHPPPRWKSFVVRFHFRDIPSRARFFDEVETKFRLNLHDATVR